MKLFYEEMIYHSEYFQESSLEEPDMKFEDVRFE